MFELALQEFARLVDGDVTFGMMPPLSGEATPVGRIVTDSRLVEPGDVFWGLIGEHHDGSEFAHEAFARGAEGIVVSRRYIEPWAGRWSVEVDDTQQALWRLAGAVRERFAGTVIGVTGSVGKTTTRQMIDTVLAKAWQGSASPNNFNNHVGVPLSMLDWNLEDDYSVVELGASHAGEIAALAGLCRPEIGVITCIGDAHLEGFGSRQAIAESKAELLDALPPSGWAVLNGDDPNLRRVAVGCDCNLVWFGRSADCDLVATDVTSGAGKLTFQIERTPFNVPVWGRHHLMAAMAAIAVGRIMQLPLAEISTALSQFASLPQRCEVIRSAGLTIVNDSYNASPTAMRAALELLRDLDAPGRRIVVLGDMKELGNAAPEAHRQLGEQAVTVCGADMLVACGEYARDVVLGARGAGMPFTRAIACRAPRDALALLKDHFSPGDALLVKGSRAMEMEQLIEPLIAPEPALVAS